MPFPRICHYVPHFSWTVISSPFLPEEPENPCGYLGYPASLLYYLHWTDDSASSATHFITCIGLCIIAAMYFLLISLMRYKQEMGNGGLNTDSRESNCSRSTEAMGTHCHRSERKQMGKFNMSELRKKYTKEERKHVNC